MRSALSKSKLSLYFLFCNKKDIFCDKDHYCFSMSELKFALHIENFEEILCFIQFLENAFSNNTKYIFFYILDISNRKSLVIEG